MQNNDQKQIAGAILIVGVLIAGAILLKGTTAPPQENVAAAGNANTGTTGNTNAGTAIARISNADRVIGNPQAKIALVTYEDFQCPFCEKFFTDSEQNIRDTYVKDGSVLLVYRDYAFLGTESTQAAEAARCAGDQGKFWEYHDYLFTHQNGENRGGFADDKLKGFAKAIGLNETIFNLCLSTDKFAQAVADSKTEATNSGVTGTPKGFILKDGKVVDTIDGAIPFSMVKQKIDAALK